MKTILVIDDDKDLRLALCKVLQHENFCTIDVEDGVTGLRMIRELHPDLVLCDIDMPVLNGFEVLKRIRQDQSVAGIPFVFITGHVNHYYRNLAFSLGVDAYLEKPVQLWKLLTTISEQLDKRNTSKFS